MAFHIDFYFKSICICRSESCKFCGFFGSLYFAWNALATMSVDNLVNQMRQTMSSGMLGTLNGELEAISTGDTDLTTAIFKAIVWALRVQLLGL